MTVADDSETATDEVVVTINGSNDAPTLVQKSHSDEALSDTGSSQHHASVDEVA